MENLKTIATKLAEKNSHLRKSAEALFDKIADATKNCGKIEIPFEKTFYFENNRNCQIFLVAGESELQYFDGYFNCDFFKNNHFCEKLNIIKLRSILKELPEVLKKMEAEMIKQSAETDELQEMILKLL